MNLFNWVKKEDINFQSDNENLRGNFLAQTYSESSAKKFVIYHFFQLNYSQKWFSQLPKSQKRTKETL